MELYNVQEYILATYILLFQSLWPTKVLVWNEFLVLRYEIASYIFSLMLQWQTLTYPYLLDRKSDQVRE